VAKNTIFCEKMQGIFPGIVKKHEEFLTKTKKLFYLNPMPRNLGNLGA
jgi:hypothetical protein